jgi:predicted branched-subunit amino acid permease
MCLFPAKGQVCEKLAQELALAAMIKQAITAINMLNITRKVNRRHIISLGMGMMGRGMGRRIYRMERPRICFLNCESWSLAAS